MIIPSVGTNNSLSHMTVSRFASCCWSNSSHPKELSNQPNHTNRLQPRLLNENNIKREERRIWKNPHSYSYVDVGMVCVWKIDRWSEKKVGRQFGASEIGIGLDWMGSYRIVRSICEGLFPSPLAYCILSCFLLLNCWKD